MCKGRGIPECILLVTQRLTKYPLMIDALIKSSKDHPDEIERLKVAQVLVKVSTSNITPMHRCINKYFNLTLKRK